MTGSLYELVDGHLAMRLSLVDGPPGETSNLGSEYEVVDGALALRAKVVGGAGAGGGGITQSQLEVALAESRAVIEQHLIDVTHPWLHGQIIYASDWVNAPAEGSLWLDTASLKLWQRVGPNLLGPTQVKTHTQTLSITSSTPVTLTSSALTFTGRILLQRVRLFLRTSAATAQGDFAFQVVTRNLRGPTVLLPEMPERLAPAVTVDPGVVWTIETPNLILSDQGGQITSLDLTLRRINPAAALDLRIVEMTFREVRT